MPNFATRKQKKLQQMAQDISTPVLLLTGYLGSGKTTLLNRILQNQQGIRFAVIVNDIGEINIDAHLIQQGGIVAQQDESLIALQNGCICCTLQMDLVEQLRQITTQHRFDYIVIEASGICEPAPIAQTICSIPQMEPKYWANGLPRLDCIVTVVDALRMKDEFDNGDRLTHTAAKQEEEDIANLVIQQIEFCNIILLNKAAEVTPTQLRHTHDIIRALQPKAKIIECNYGDIPLNQLLHTNLFDFDKVATSATWIDAIENDHTEEEHHEEHDEHHDEHEEHHEHHSHEEHDEHHSHDDHEEEHHHCHHCGNDHDHCHCHHHHHDHHGETEEYGIGTWVYQARRPLSLTMFDDFIARLWPRNIIRAKGICWFKGEEDICYLFEQAGKQFSLKNCGQWYATMPQDQLSRLLDAQPKLRQDWDDQYGDRMQKIVFIGQKMDAQMKEYLQELLDACLA